MITKRPEREIPAAAFDFSQGYARLKLGDVDFAKACLAKVKKVAETSRQEFRNHPAARLGGIMAGILDGEIAWTEGHLDDAIAKFEAAAQLDDEDPDVDADLAKSWSRSDTWIRSSRF